MLAGLGLRPKALVAWRRHVLNRLLDAQMQSDPAGLLADLEAGRWQEVLPEDRRMSLREDAEEALARRRSVDEIKRTQTSGGKALELSQSIEAGRAGLADIRQAEEAGALSSPQSEVLRGEAKLAEIALQAQQMASDELAVSLSSGVGFDLENPQNRQAADAFYESIYSQTLRTGTSKEALAQVVSMVSKTGYLPPRLARDVTGLLLGSDESLQVKGAELYGQLREAAPDLIEEAIDLEARARGGVLQRWLDAGLEPADALRRAKAEFARDGMGSALNEETTAGFQQDLRKRFGDLAAGRIAGNLLGRLDEKYLSLLGRGLPPAKARAQIHRDLGRAFVNLEHIEAQLAEAGFLPGERDGKRVLIPTEPRLQKMADPATLTMVGMGAVIVVAAAMTWSIQTSKDIGFEVPEELEELNTWLNELPDEMRLHLFEALPDMAAWFDKTAVRFSDRDVHLGDIESEDESTGIRVVELLHRDHGWLTIRQQKDPTTGDYDNIDVTLWDWEKKKYVTEKFPNTRFDLSPDHAAEAAGAESALTEGGGFGADGSLDDGSQTMVIPPEGALPHALPGPSSEPDPRFGTVPPAQNSGRERVPLHTGGNQTDLGPLTELAPGFPAQEQEPQIHISPDDREKLRKYQALLLANVPADGPGLPAGLTEADLKPATSNENPSVLSTPGHAWTPTDKLSEMDNMLKHHDDHAGDFVGVTSVSEYVQETHAFVNNPPEGVLAKIRENGDILLYHKETNTFAVRDVNGVPRTMFKPKPGIKYWHAQ